MQLWRFQRSPQGFSSRPPNMAETRDLAHSPTAAGRLASRRRQRHKFSLPHLVCPQNPCPCRFRVVRQATWFSPLPGFGQFSPSSRQIPSRQPLGLFSNWLDLLGNAATSPGSPHPPSFLGNSHKRLHLLLPHPKGVQVANASAGKEEKRRHAQGCLQTRLLVRALGRLAWFPSAQHTARSTGRILAPSWLLPATRNNAWP
mmetsp:Transcript_55729/g.129997  ORF Transcript_55729/g.129997 Transcript_55729/m.129997 type:complete len:201 (+) Transcript_55729:213-815(+)